MILSAPTIPSFTVPDPTFRTMLAAAQVDIGVLVVVAIFAVGAVASLLAIRSKRKDETISVHERLVAAYKQEAELERMARREAEQTAATLQQEWFEKLAVRIAQAVAQTMREEMRRGGHT